MKTHLYDYKQLCGVPCSSRSDRLITTLDWEQVDCDSCKATNEYKRLKSEAEQKLKHEVMQIGADLMKEKQEKTCNNCSWCKELSCTNKFNQSKEFKFLDNKCAQWTDKLVPPPCADKLFETKDINALLTKPNDPAIELLNDFAEMLKLSELNAEEKLKVIDFLESRVRKAKL